MSRFYGSLCTLLLNSLLSRKADVIDSAPRYSESRHLLVLEVIVRDSEKCSELKSDFLTSAY